MNEYDSNRIADLFKSSGYLQSLNIQDTNFYVLNTCHIREKSTEKVYSDIGRLKKNYRNKSKPIVLVTGCVAQAENEEMLKREPYIDAVIGPQSYHDIPKILKNLDKNTKKFNLTDFDVIEKFDKLNLVKNSNSNVSAFITIQEGCDKFCNFCVVPYTRGAEYSRSPKDIILEANDLVKNGAREITLLGQNVNAYKFIDAKKEIRLSNLINRLSKIEELKRIRYTTSHPKDMTQDLIQCYKNSNKLMPFLHLPVQSGSDRILNSMNRKHTSAEYLSTINKLLKINPEIKKFIENNSNTLKKIGRINEFVTEDIKKPSANLVIKGEIFKIYFDEDVDLSKIKETLLNKKNKIEKEMEKINTRLNNKSFIERAPNDIVEQEKSNFINLEKDVNKLNYTLESL